MKKTSTIAILALLALAVPGLWLLPESVSAQNADPDGDDDDNDPPDDDGDVPDPDDPDNDPPDVNPGDSGGSDPGGDGGGESDPGGSADPGGGDDGGGADPGGDDGGSPGGAGGGSGDDDGPGGDDGGSALGGAGGADDDGGGDDGPPTAGGGSGGDDDDDDGPAAAAGVGGDDDDDAPSTGSPAGGDDDDDAPAAGVPSGDDDDDTNTGGVPERGGDDGDEIDTIGGGDEDESERIRLDERDGIEVDREGFRYRRNEFVALDLGAKDVARLQSDGYRIVKSERLGSLQGTVYLLKSPARIRDFEALAQIESVADPATLGLNHLFDSSSARVKRAAGKSPVARPACGCQIGLIDTGVAAQLPMFRHATVEQKSFNGPTVTPKLHGTAIAHLFAGTAARPNRRTRVVVGDIFSGPRAESGSTYALVKALDWMATKGVPVINVSLAGPRNPVVAAAIDRLTKRGHLVVAAAGNDGPAAPPVFPGAYSGVVAVTAVDAGRQVYRYANRGNYIDFSAFGVNVPSIDPRGTLTSATGTSFAAPVVAARLAGRMAKPDVRVANALVAELEKSARDLGSPGRDGTFGHGLIDTGNR